MANGAAAFETIRFNHGTEEDGLSQGSVQAIVQDHRGFIWIATQRGLNRFDGYEFVQYLHDPDDPASLSEHWIWALHVDRTGALWVGTRAGGLDRLQPDTGTITRYPDVAEGLRTRGVRAIASDQDGRIWVGSDGGGVSRLDPETGAIRRFRFDPENPGSLSSDRVKALHFDAAGYLWVGTDGGGLNRIDPVHERVSRYRLAGDADRVRSIVSDARGMLWIGTIEQGLFLFDPLDGSVVRQYRHKAGDATSLSSDSIRVLLVDEEQRLWVGTDSHGVNRLDPVSGGLTRIRHDPSSSGSLSNDHVSSLFQDQGGVLWVGTQAGFNTWNPLTGAFSNINRKNSSGLSSNTVLSFAELPDGRLLIGTNGGGISVADLQNQSVERFDLEHGKTALSDDRVFALHASRDGGVWAGTRAGGLSYRNPESGAWSTYRHDPADAGSLSFDGVTTLLETADGTLWVGTYLGGLNRFERATGTFTHFRHDPADPSSLCSDRVLDMLEDREGRFWLGTHGGGICEYDRDAGVFRAIRHDPADPTSLSSNEPWRLAESPAGDLWIGTPDRGVNVWRFADRQAGRRVFSRISVAQGLGSPAVYGLVPDARGRVWVAGNLGITRIDGETGAMHQYTAIDGLQGNEFNFAAAYRTARGQLFFGGMNGLTAFFPEQIDINRHAPSVALTRFERNDEIVPLASQKNAGGEVQLPHTVRRVAFEFAALDFTDPTGNRYAHRLVGFDADWLPDQSRRRVTYTNLPAGSYELQVRATNNDGVPGANELRVPFTMLPAPWATWWAQASYVLALLLLLFLAYRMQARKLERAAEMNRVQSSLISEITARQIKEAELAQTRNRAQRYLDVVEVIILALDRHGTVTLVNQKGVRVLGYGEAEIIGRNFYECFVPEAQREEVRSRFQHLEQYAYSESPIKPKDGDERMIAWHAIAAPSLEGDDAGGVLISGADVTQMRNIERQLRDAQKMDALGTLARGVAHDFNNILTSILGHVQLAQLAKPKAAVAAHLDKLEISVVRARDLVARILSFGRASGNAPRVVRVDETVRDALELVTPLFGPNVRIVTDLEGADGAVLADPTQLLQVVLNLCTNAAQAMGEDGGTLRVGVSNYEVGVEQARSLAVLVPGEHVRLTVSDTGPGMDDYTLTRIFDPFFTTRRREEGTGLGLSVVHRIVTQLRGAVQVFSSPGEGARFEILLPRTRRQPDPEAVEPQPDVALEGTETLLFVDDEPSVRAIGNEALSKLGYRVLLAGDAPEALEIFEARGHEIDAVITDQTMPSQLGHKLAEAFKAIRPEVPVLLMSGADRPASSCVDGFVEKPFSLTTLARAVRELLVESPPADESRR